MVTPAARREAVAHLRTTFGVSERRACEVLGADRTSVRYRGQRRLTARYGDTRRDLVLGAFVTALLFTIGKSLIGIYIGRAAPSSPYGAAGALIVLMFWTYYSAQIFLFGTELTKAIADERAPADRQARGGTIQQSVSSLSNKDDKAVTAMTRSVEELREESERSRAQLAATVDRLREQITDTTEDLRYKVSPQGTKSEVSEFVSRKTQGWLDMLKQQANGNPMQAIAAGTAVAVPALRLARGFPLPLLMIGAGVALTSNAVRARAAEAVAPTVEKIKEIAGEATERATTGSFRSRMGETRTRSVSHCPAVPSFLQSSCGTSVKVRSGLDRRDIAICCHQFHVAWPMDGARLDGAVVVVRKCRRKLQPQRRRCAASRTRP
jgi:hypothetical protein